MNLDMCFDKPKHIFPMKESNEGKQILILLMQPTFPKPHVTTCADNMQLYYY